MNLFSLRPTLRLNMAVFEAKYRKDTKDIKPLSRGDRYMVRAYVVNLLREEMRQIDVPLLPYMVKKHHIH